MYYLNIIKRRKIGKCKTEIKKLQKNIPALGIRRDRNRYCYKVNVGKNPVKLW